MVDKKGDSTQNNNNFKSTNQSELGGQDKKVPNPLSPMEFAIATIPS